MLQTLHGKLSGETEDCSNIDYHGAINVNDFSHGEVPLTLDVKNTQDQKIGSLTVNLSAGAEYARYNPSTDQGEKYVLYQNSKGELFLVA